MSLLSPVAKNSLLSFCDVRGKKPKWLTQGRTYRLLLDVKRTQWDGSSLQSPLCQERLAVCQSAPDTASRNSGHPRRPRSSLLWPWWTCAEPATGIWSGLCKSIWRHPTSLLLRLTDPLSQIRIELHTTWRCSPLANTQTETHSLYLEIHTTTYCLLSNVFYYS